MVNCVGLEIEVDACPFFQNHGHIDRQGCKMLLSKGCSCIFAQEYYNKTMAQIRQKLLFLLSRCVI